MRGHEPWNVGRYSKVLVGHPPRINDVDQHQGFLARREDEYVIEAMVDAVIAQFERLATQRQIESLVENHAGRPTPRVSSARQQLRGQPMGDDLCFTREE